MKFNELIKKGEITSKEKISHNNFANLFNVVNKGKSNYFNISKSINFSNIEFFDKSLYTEYLVQETDCWTNISYKNYGTIELWWLIAKFNNIKNPFTELVPGTYLKIPGDEIKEAVLDTINMM